MIQTVSSGLFGQVLYYLYTNGFYSAVLPFFVMFILLYAAISRIHLFKGNVAMSSVLALILALLVIFPYAVQDPSNPLYNVTPGFIGSLQPVSVAIIAIVLVMLVFEFLGGKYDSEGWLAKIVSATVSLIVLVAIVMALMANYHVKGLHWNMSWWGPFWSQLFSPGILSALTMLFFFVVFVLLIMRGISTNDGENGNDKKK